MMGSSPPPQPPQVAGLAMVAEFLELLRNAEPTLAARLDELRQAEARIAAAIVQLEKADQAHLTAAAELVERESKIQAASDEFAPREAAVKANAAETAARQATFDGQAAALVARTESLNAREEKIEQKRLDDAAKLRSEGIDARAEIAREQEALTRARRDNEAAMQATREKAATDIAELQAKMDAEFAGWTEALVEREKTVAAREDALRERSAQLRTALGN
jgi:chromosome segregation ATPase